jgi:hypothetical protein
LGIGKASAAFRARCAPQGPSGLLVGLAANDKLKDLPLTRRQCRDMSTNRNQFAFQARVTS